MAIDAITQCNLSPTFRIRLEHKDGHYKFWEATGRPNGDVVVRYGRIGDWGKLSIKIGLTSRKKHHKSSRRATQ